jgi:glycosyltransferase involved in cell wall biosynthesis
MHHCPNANAARNYGVSFSSGTYIAFLDSNDEWREDHIENCLREMGSKEVDFLYGPAVIDDGEKERVREAWPIGGSAIEYLQVKIIVLLLLLLSL